MPTTCPARGAFTWSAICLHHLGEEGAGARRRIENLDLVHVLLDRDRLALLVVLAGVPIDRDLAGVGEAIGQAELGLSTSSTARTMKSTTGSGVYQTPRLLRLAGL